MKSYINLIVCFLFSPALVAQDHTPISSHALDSLPVWMARFKVPVMGVGVIENAEVVQTKVFGTMDNGSHATANTLFNVASLTKPVTAITILKLIEAGKLKLDESLDPYWIDPDIASDPRHRLPTPRLLLSHQSGFLNWRQQEAGHKLVFFFQPGEKFGYSGEGYEYLRHVVETKSGHSLQQLASSNLFIPLGLSATHYGWTADIDSTLFAGAHDSLGLSIKVKKLTITNAADWLITTIGGYTSFGAYVLHRAGLSQQLYKNMVTGQVLIKPGTQDAMGLGWEVISNLESGGYLLMHTGQDAGITTLIVLLPDSGKGMVFLSNSENGFDVMKLALKKALHIKEITP